MPGEHHIVVDETVRPVIHLPRRVPLNLQPRLKQHLDKLVDKGILIKRDEPTDWVNSLLVVEKKDKSLRLLMDPRDLNRAIKREHHIVPMFDDIVAKLHGKNVFSVIDMADGFYHIVLDSDSSRLCTFNSPFGRYSYKRMSMGLSSSPEVFQKKAQEAFGDIEGVNVVFDDLIIAAADDQEHDRILRSVFERARSWNIRFNKKKIQLKVPQVRYLGHIISAGGIKPDDDKVRAIVEMKQPVDKKGVQRLLGTITFLSKYIANFSALMEPLRALVRHDAEFIWSNTHQMAFENIKHAVSSAPVLRFFDPTRPVVIQTDASGYRSGCVPHARWEASCILFQSVDRPGDKMGNVRERAAWHRLLV